MKYKIKVGQVYKGAINYKISRINENKSYYMCDGIDNFFQYIDKYGQVELQNIRLIKDVSDNDCQHDCCKIK